MARRILGRASGIGKKWPYSALNFLPARQLWKYLAWKSAGRGTEPSFDLGKNLNRSRRILVILPDSFQEILLAMPVLQSLVSDIPDITLQLVVNQRDIFFLTAMFGPENVLGIKSEDFFWGEAHFRELEKTLQIFKPDLALNLNPSPSPLLCYLLRASQANLRAQVGNLPSAKPKKAGSPPDSTQQQAPWPFVNITLNCNEPANHLKRFIFATTLWNFSQYPVTCKWSRLQPSEDQMKEATNRLVSKGLRPESTRIFLWQGAASPYQQDVFTAAVTERQSAGASKSLLMLIATGAPFFETMPPVESMAGIPCIEAESIGLLLAFFAQTACSIGLNGSLLHLASLADTDVVAHFQAQDEPWDTSFLNPRLKIIYQKQLGGGA
jgi:hypothetical protein